MQAGRTQHEDAQHLQQCEARDSAAYSDCFRDIGMDARVGIVVSSQSQKGVMALIESPQSCSSIFPGRGARLAQVGAGCGAADFVGCCVVVAESVGRPVEGDDDGSV